MVNVIKINFEIGGHIRSVDKNYNSVKNNAVAIEWMIKKHSLKNMLLEFMLLKLDQKKELISILRERLKSEMGEIKKLSENMKKSDKKLNSIFIEDKILKNKDIKITVKWAKGRVIDIYPGVNLILPLDECEGENIKKFFIIEVSDGIEILYKLLYYITASDIFHKGYTETIDYVFR